MSTARPTAVAVVVLFAAFLGARPARADEAAAEAFREGLRRYEAAEYPEARASFEEAYRISPDVRVLANIADCFTHEGKPGDAVRTYRRFLEEAGDQVPASARRLVERRVSELRGQVCDLLVVAEPAGSTIRIDDVEVGTAPMNAPWAVDAGQHAIEVRLAGHQTVRRTVQARAGGDLEVAVALVRETAGPAEHQPPPPPTEVQREPRSTVSSASTPLGRGPLVWTTLTVTAALAIAGTVTGLVALSQESEYRDPQTAPARRRALYADRETMPLVTDVLLDAAVVTGLVTVGLLLFAGPAADATSADEQAMLSPRWLGDGGVACDLRLAF